MSDNLMRSAINQNSANMDSTLLVDWNKIDPSQMISNLIQIESSSVQTSSIENMSSNLESRSLNLDENQYGEHYPNDWGSVDLNGLGSYPGGWESRPDVIKMQQEEARVDSINIFHNVFNRDPNNNELVNAANAVYGANGSTKQYNALQKKLAYSKEGHDRIANIGIDVLGYAPSEDWIKQEQAKLAVYGTTQNTIRNDFAYSQTAHDILDKQSFDMLGYHANEATLQSQQSQLANGTTLATVHHDFAYSQAVTDAIGKVGSDILGRSVTLQSDRDWIELMRSQELNNTTLSQIRYQQAHGALGDSAADEILKSILGRNATDSDTAWKNAVKDGLGSNQTYAQIRYDQAHGVLGDFATNQIYKTITGRDTTTADQAWKNAMESGLGNNMTYAQILHQESHSFLGNAMVQQMAQQKGLQLTSTAVNDQEDLIERQGFSITQSQFNNVADIYKNIAGTKDVVFTDKFSNYQQMGSNKQIIKAIYNDLASTIDPSFKVNLVDDNGNIVYGAEGMLDSKGEIVENKVNDKPAQIPVGFYSKIDDIISQGKDIAASKPEYNTSVGGPGSIMTQDDFNQITNLFVLSRFGHGGIWDVQRLYVTSGIDYKLRDVSTINIGIYAAASGMSLNDILTVENTYVQITNADFNWKINSPDKVYKYLPVRNVENTKIGYELYKNGQIKGH